MRKQQQNYTGSKLPSKFGKLFCLQTSFHVFYLAKQELGACAQLVRYKRCHNTAQPLLTVVFLSSIAPGCTQHTVSAYTPSYVKFIGMLTLRYICIQLLCLYVSRTLCECFFFIAFLVWALKNLSSLIAVRFHGIHTQSWYRFDVLLFPASYTT